jgi:hypothetical protein
MRFAAGLGGPGLCLACGLALAVRPGGSAETPARKGGCPCGWRGRQGQRAAFRPGSCDSFAQPLAHPARDDRSGQLAERRHPVRYGGVRLRQGALLR